MLRWRKAVHQIQKLGNLLYANSASGVLTNMSTQEPVLRTSPGNKGKKKAVGMNAKGRKRGHSVEEDRYNASLELSIEEGIENLS